jgi:acyl carrier protein
MPDELDEAGMAQLLIQAASEELNIELGDITPDTSLEDLGMDSMDRLELVTMLEERLGVRVPDEIMEGIKTLGDLVRSLVGLQRSRSEATAGE